MVRMSAWRTAVEGDVPNDSRTSCDAIIAGETIVLPQGQAPLWDEQGTFRVLAGSVQTVLTKNDIDREISLLTAFAERVKGRSDLDHERDRALMSLGVLTAAANSYPANNGAVS